MRSSFHQGLGILLAATVIVLSLSTPVRSILCLPDSQKMVVGEKTSLSLTLPKKLAERMEVSVLSSPSVFSSPADQPVVVNRDDSGYDIRALKPGRADVQLKLLGYIPLKSIAVESVPPRRVVVGGHSIGVLLKSRGIMVVGYAPVISANGEKSYPAKQQGIEIGDLILKVNGRTVYTENELAGIIDGAGRKRTPVEVTLKKEREIRTMKMLPTFCPETQRYRIGLYVRDGVAGVGTLSFWEPQTGRYAALGHIIVDADTKKGIDVRRGRIVSALIQTIRPARPGRPGEKIGIFDPEGVVTGTITRNTFSGIYGKFEQKVDNLLYPYPLEVAYAHQVQKGKAQILTVINGSQIESFDIEVDKVYPHRQNGKGMIIHVTDPRLLSVTGGIIQGMSGSPIIQNGKIIGVVTHVFLNDPERGYGIFMDSMLREMDEVENYPSKYRQIAS
ncbi:MAG: SpoIVB peptidase [Syntrophomonadaceae bacterium]|nr:SpoIVB peptidase [Syntrophomonadaceae bacterium]